MSTNPRQYNLKDRWIIGINQVIAAITSTQTEAARPSPAATMPEATLCAAEKIHAGSLMRINHTGEICAQALYLGQSITTNNTALRACFKKAAQEEADHLHWCAERLAELNTHQSYLNPLWFSGSFLIGAVAGVAGDSWSLGFLVATEEQVCEHLETHLEHLPALDKKSRRILQQMHTEEAEHATNAMRLGAVTLPWPIRILMRTTSKLMTSITYYV